MQYHIYNDAHYIIINQLKNKFSSLETLFQHPPRRQTVHAKRRVKCIKLK